MRENQPDGRKALVNEIETRDKIRFLENVPARMHIGTLVSVSGDKATVELQGRIIEQAILIGDAPGIGVGVPVIYAGNTALVLGDATSGGGGGVAGLIFGGEVHFETPGTFAFDKADYPGLAYIEVEVQGGGGAGGGAIASTSGNVSWGGGGGGGGYARKFAIPAASLAASEVVTVGAAGVGASGVLGGNGGVSSFGAHASAGGGTGGGVNALSSTGTATTALIGGPGGVGTIGDELAAGERGRDVHYTTGGSGGGSPNGGASRFSQGPQFQLEANGNPGRLGAGGGGMRNSGAQAAKTGGAGGPGLVRVRLWFSTSAGTPSGGPGLIFGGSLYFTASGSFNKADYPYLAAVEVEVQGPGGSGGGVAATVASQAAVGAGGGGGGYARKQFLASALAASESVVVGTGGAAPAAGANNGNAGSGVSSFAGVSAGAGAGGAGAASAVSGWVYEGGTGGGSGGDINLFGSAGGRGIWATGSPVSLGYGGSSVLAPIQSDWTNSAISSAGTNGRPYGGGGAGAYAIGSSGAAGAGGAGGNGIVIIHLFYAANVDLGITGAGYRVGQPIVYSADGVFNKADYPGLRAVIVELQGPGGSGGGAPATAAGEGSIGTGGGGGGYLKKFLLESALTASEAVVVPAGAAAAAAGSAGVAGANTTNFGSHGFAVNGGGAGQILAAGSTLIYVAGAGGGNASGGDVHGRGGVSANGIRFSSGVGMTSAGGGAHWSMTGGLPGSNAGGSVGNVGTGGGGTINGASQAARAGGAGGPAVVIVTPLY